ncbi:GNAT family N-acetyltransferase [Fulvimonas sp. R45]|uniref:GNAT family N-acetyltransferase n=1 Tax=Fulvimonas sp. R45 TaxID=3045937 RepID=UPI00265F65F6|nr:GNAT family N-acetyltransferase [Fulvimonas sp. R45]MDO1527404.1 GNAT family N-acetyltransferase [Fulvimonas sp. R45]
MSAVAEPVLRLEIPAADEYRALRVAAGLSAMSPEGAAAGLPASWCSVCVRAGDELVGMGRVVGDGGLFLFVVDIAVAPAWQGRGWGRRIMAALMEQVHARACPRTMVGLIADGTASRLYEQFGFRLTAPGAHGMLLRL